MNNEKWVVKNHRLAKFLHRFDSQLRKKMREPYYAEKPLKGLRIAVIGAGPGGLRFAVEAALLGADVHVVEGREKFSRYNVLKLWEYSMQDLISIGVKDLYPELTLFSVKRVPIAVLQHTLSRVALALGVTIHPACKLTGLNCPTAGERVALEFRDSCPSLTHLKALQFHGIYDATGTAAVLRDAPCYGESHLVGPVVTYGKEAIGMTMNFKRFPKGERKLYDDTKDRPEFAGYNPAKDDTTNLGYQFQMDLFNSKIVLLENWVYWKSAVSHYIVATIPRGSLVKYGVVPESSTTLPINELLKSVDKDKVVELGLEISREWNFPHQSEDASAFIENSRGKPDINIFNYGGSTKAKAAVRILSGQTAADGMIFGLIGDAIETPFWPKGTGANHAIYSAQTQAYALLAWAKGMTADKTTSLARVLTKQVLHLPINGNRRDFKAKDYHHQVKDSYAKIAKSEMPHIF